MDSCKKRFFLGMIWLISLIRVGESFADDEESSCLRTGSNNECLAKADLLGHLDLAAPTNPLFTLMGATPESVVTPKTGDELMFSFLPKAVDAFGDENYAVALELNPGLMMLPDQIAISDLGFFDNEHNYAEKLKLARVLSRLNLSMVANKKTGDFQATQYGIGISYNYDTKNPMINNADYRSCVSVDEVELLEMSASASRFLNALDRELVEIGIASGELEAKRTVIKQKLAELTSIKLTSIRTVLQNEGVEFSAIDNSVTILMSDGSENTMALKDGRKADDVLDAISSALKSVFKQRDQLHDKVTACAEEVSKWNRDVFAVGLALYRTDETRLTNISVNSESSEGDATGFGVWLSMAFETSFAETEGQFIVNARYNDSLVQNRIDDSGVHVEHVDLWSMGGRYIQQLSPENQSSKFTMGDVRGFAELAYFDEDSRSTHDSYWQAGIGAEILIRDDLYFQFVFGDTFDSELERSSYLSGQFKWSLSKVPAH
jgi:hypothetical protein